MGFFQKTWYWRLELAPMYMRVMTQSLTSKEQEFRVLCGLTTTSLFAGKRLPQVGELMKLPGFEGKYTVSTIRVVRFGSKEINSKDSPAIVYFDPKQMGGEEYWTKGFDQMRPVKDWQWSTSFDSADYRFLGYTPSDWANPDLKLAERDYVLSWKKSGSEMLTPEGEFFSRFNPKHNYLFEWFPEVKRHVQNMTNIF